MKIRFRTYSVPNLCVCKRILRSTCLKFSSYFWVPDTLDTIQQPMSASSGPGSAVISQAKFSPSATLRRPRAGLLQTKQTRSTLGFIRRAVNDLLLFELLHYKNGKFHAYYPPAPSTSGPRSKIRASQLLSTPPHPGQLQHTAGPPPCFKL